MATDFINNSMLLVLSVLVLWAVFLGLLKFIKRTKFHKDFLPVVNLHEMTAQDFNSADHEIQTQVHMIIYHFFEELWKEYPTCTKPSELFEKYLINSSSLKLKHVFIFFGDLSGKSSTVNPKTIATRFIACSCMSVVFRRKYLDTKLSFYVKDHSKIIYNTPIEICPTLQIYIWQERFSGVREKSDLHPFRIEYEKPNHKPEDELASN